MPPRLHIVQRARIIALWQTGARISDICRTMGVTKRTVYWWVRRFEEEGEESLEDRPRLKKRKRATTAEEDRAILELHMKDGMSRTKETAAKYNISMQTVRRRLHEGGLKLTNPIQRKMDTNMSPMKGDTMPTEGGMVRGAGGVAGGGTRARRGAVRRGAPRGRHGPPLGAPHAGGQQCPEGQNPGVGVVGLPPLPEPRAMPPAPREWEPRRPQPYDWQRPGPLF